MEVGCIRFFDEIILYIVFDKIICPTHSVQKTLGTLGRWFSKKNYIAYPGVELPEESEIKLRCIEQQDDTIIFGCIGTLWAAIKGQDIIIRAVSQSDQRKRTSPN